MANNALFICRSLLRADTDRGDTVPGESDLALAARGSTGDLCKHFVKLKVNVFSVLCDYSQQKL